MSSVRRVYVEKKPDFAVQAKDLKHEIHSYLGISEVTGVRVLIRYDVEPVSYTHLDVYKRQGKGMGNCVEAGICHSFSADGRCISLLKILLTNECVFDCHYCVNRCSNDVPRAAFTPDEVCQLTMEFYRRNYIEGLFLSSGVFQNPAFTMELLYQTLYRPVSYTHLDVYKRQIWIWSSIL